jgi:transaldolase
MNAALSALSRAGVSIWLDDLSRSRLVSGGLAVLAAHDNVVGVTTNPTIFAKAISGSDDYDAQLRDLAVRGVDVRAALRELTTYDVRWACDVLRPAYEATHGLDGRVSIEVDPRLAYDTDATIAEARALWWHQDPGRPAGHPGHRRLPGRGHQHQRHADLLAAALRRGHGCLPGRPGARPAGRP